MQQYSIIIFLLAISIFITALSPRIKLPYPILMILAGIGVGFIPEFYQIQINPDVIFLIFLPPLLSNAAFNMSFTDFKSEFKTISKLAVVLVFITTLSIAAVTHYILPEIGWPLAFVLGAILSPPDAIAAKGIMKNLKLSHRTFVILEGESLVNDASALITYRIAVAAVGGTAFVWWKAGLQFIYAIIGGLLIGYIIWRIFELVIRKIKFENTVIVSLNLLIPFVAYLLAEELKASGVLAVVVTGILLALKKDKIFTAKTINQSTAIWDIIVFLLNGLVFILIGLEFPHVLKSIPNKSILFLTFCSFVIFLAALFTRTFIIFFQKYGINKYVFSKLFRKKNNFKKSEALNWKDLLIISWTGMRGIVSLATALALPVVLSNGEAFPYRHTILFLTVMVVIMMLLIQGLGLPLLLKWLKLSESMTPEQIDKLAKTANEST